MDSVKSDEDQLLEEEGGADELQLFTEDQFDPQFRVSTWQQTILGELISVRPTETNNSWKRFAVTTLQKLS